jgi:hypothetical protein
MFGFNKKEPDTGPKMVPAMELAPDKRTNNNILADMWCPHCMFEGPFTMTVYAYARGEVSDGGYFIGDMDTLGSDIFTEAPVTCLRCGYEGSYDDFSFHTPLSTFSWSESDMAQLESGAGQ